MPARAGVVVRELRQHVGLTQRRLAIRAGTTQSAISRIERGVESPTVERLEQILLSMGKQLELVVAPLEAWADDDDLADARAMTPDQRLAHGLALSRFASEFVGAAARGRDAGK